MALVNFSIAKEGASSAPIVDDSGGSVIDIGDTRIAWGSGFASTNTGISLGTSFASSSDYSVTLLSDEGNPFFDHQATVNVRGKSLSSFNADHRFDDDNNISNPGAVLDFIAIGPKP